MKKLKERIQNNFKKNKRMILVFLMIWVIVVAFTLCSYKNSLGKRSYGNSNYHYIQQLQSGDELIQEVEVIDGVDAISIRFEVYKKNNSTVNIEVIGSSSGQIYGSKTMKIKNILGASFNTIGLDSVLDSLLDKKVKIIVSTKDDNGAIGVWCSNTDVFDNGQLTINGSLNNAEMSLKLLKADDTFMFFNKAIIIPLISGITLFILFVFLFEPKKEVIFTILVLFFGLIYIFVITPLSAPDEEYHYRQVLIVSNKMLGKENVNEIEDTYLGYYNFVSDYNVGCAYETIVNKLFGDLPELSSRTKFSIGSMEVYSYELCYYPQAIGVTCARLLKLNNLLTYYFGRLFSLLFYGACTYFSIRVATKFKMMIGIFALLPICLQQGMAYGQDMWIISLSMLVFAYLIKFYFTDKKISKFDYLSLLIIEILLTPCKSIYSLFILTFIIVPTNRFHSFKHKFIALLILFLPMIKEVGGTILYKLFPTFYIRVFADTVGSAEVGFANEYYSLSYIIANPFKTIRLILYTLRVNLKPWLAAATGRYLSGLTLIVPSKLSYFVVLLLFLSSLIGDNSAINPFTRKLVMVMTCALIFGFTMMAMLTGWTDINDETIQGIQGRYLTPLIPFVLSIFNNKKIYIKEKYENILLFIEILISFEVIIYILSFTYVF